MPRFLNTYTGQFEWHEDPTRVQYAILSHTWRAADDGGEQSFEEVRRLQSSSLTLTWKPEPKSTLSRLSKPDYPHPTLITYVPDLPYYPPPPISTPTSRATSLLDHPDLSEKVRQACLVARKNGIRLIWIDSCCIDKSSSAELSEAINSMYELYRASVVCYVYLADVLDGDHPQAPGSSFRFSRWHERGWTLQELIAPERVIFLTSTWRFLGTRLGLASTLEEITTIGADILVGRANVASVSVARRMSWASLRETTRAEDRAYSLLGIFGVHLSPIYGEGSNAFFRLQQEITKTIPDQSIFAWGTSCNLLSLNRGEVIGWMDPAPNLLASSPWSFSRYLSNNIRPMSPAAFASRLGLAMEDMPPMHCVFTPQGVRIQLLCIDLTAVSQIFDTFSAVMDRTSPCDECTRLGRAHLLALLQCEDSAGSLIALPLCRAPIGVDEQLQLTLAIATHIDCGQLDHESFHNVRLAKAALTEMLPHLLPAPVEVSLLGHDPHRTSPTNPREVVVDDCPVALWQSHAWEKTCTYIHFRLAPWCVDQLSALGSDISPVVYMHWVEPATVSSSHRNMITLSTRIRSTAQCPVGQGELQEIIYLRVVLCQVGSASRLAAPDTTASFTIIYPSSLDFDPSNAGFYLPAFPPGIVQREEERASEFNSQSPRMTLAEVEFVLPQAPHKLNTSPASMRLLRVRLELPFERADGAAYKVLLLSVDISDRIPATPTSQNTGDERVEEDSRPPSPCSTGHSETIHKLDPPSLTLTESPGSDGPFWYAMTTPDDGEKSSSENRALGHEDANFTRELDGSRRRVIPQPSEPSEYDTSSSGPRSRALSTGSTFMPPPTDPSDAVLRRLEALQRDNDALRAQASDMGAQVIELTRQNISLFTQMDQVFSQLNSLRN